MCIAIYKPKDAKFPTRNTLKNCWNNNPDGAGIAIHVPAVKKGQEPTVKIIKGLMTFKQFYKTLRTMPIEENEVVLHFRWATSGTVDEGMTHPFPITNDRLDLKSLEIECDRAIVHNGVMFSPKYTENWSDTAIFARWLHVVKPSGNRMRKVLGSDRLAIIDKHNGVKLCGSWTNINGCYFSNNHSHYTASYYKGSSYKADDYAYNWLTHKYEYTPKSSSISSRYSRNSHGTDYDNSFAYHDSRHELDEAIQTRKMSEMVEMGICPLCQSDNVYMIGLKSDTCECQDCGTVYNDNDYLVPSTYIEKMADDIDTDDRY